MAKVFLSEDQRLILDEMFRRLVRLVGFRDEAFARDFSFGTQVDAATVDALDEEVAADIYVDTTNGLDTNSGASNRPLKTIQAAINKLPERTAADITIHVKRGTYTENLHLSTTQMSRDKTLKIIADDYDAFTPATGAASGTFSSTSGNVATVAGATWTTNDLKGKFLKVTSGSLSGKLIPIVSNTATGIKVPHLATALNGCTFSFVTLACVLAAPVNASFTVDLLNGMGPTAANITITGFDISPGTKAGVNMAMASARFESCKFTGAVTAHWLLARMSVVEIAYCYSATGWVSAPTLHGIYSELGCFHDANGGLELGFAMVNIGAEGYGFNVAQGSHFEGGTILFRSHCLTVINGCTFQNGPEGASALRMQNGSNFLGVYGTTIDNYTLLITTSDNSVSSPGHANEVFVGASSVLKNATGTGYTNGAAIWVPRSHSQIRLDAVSIENCPVGINLRPPESKRSTHNQCSITTNTTFTNMVLGDVTLDGTTYITKANIDATGNDIIINGNFHNSAMIGTA